MCTSSASELRGVFAAVDTDGSGTISYSELLEGLRSIGAAVPEEDIRNYMDKVQRYRGTEVGGKQHETVTLDHKNPRLLQKIKRILQNELYAIMDVTPGGIRDIEVNRFAW